MRLALICAAGLAALPWAVCPPPISSEIHPDIESLPSSPGIEPVRRIISFESIPPRSGQVKTTRYTFHEELSMSRRNTDEMEDPVKGKFVKTRGTWVLRKNGEDPPLGSFSFVLYDILESWEPKLNTKKKQKKQNRHDAGYYPLVSIEFREEGKEGHRRMGMDHFISTFSDPDNKALFLASMVENLRSGTTQGEENGKVLIPKFESIQTLEFKFGIPETDLGSDVMEELRSWPVPFPPAEGDTGSVLFAIAQPESKKDPDPYRDVMKHMKATELIRNGEKSVVSILNQKIQEHDGWEHRSLVTEYGGNQLHPVGLLFSRKAGNPWGLQQRRWYGNRHAELLQQRAEPSGLPQEDEGNTEKQDIPV